MPDQIVSDDLCFCCGKDNNRGLGLTFEYDGEGQAKAFLIIPEWFSGWRRMTHGGLLSTLLDESMAHACISVLGHAITAELTVRYHNPVAVGTCIEMIGTVVSVRGKVVETSAVIRDSEQRKIATGQARFMLLRPHK